PPDRLPAAMAGSRARAGGAALLGPALGGWLFALHRLLPFLFDAVSYLASALLINQIRTPLHPAAPGGTAAPAGGTAVPDRRLSAGARYLVADRELRTVVGYGGVINLIGVSAL